MQLVLIYCLLITLHFHLFVTVHNFVFDNKIQDETAVEQTLAIGKNYEVDSKSRITFSTCSIQQIGK